MPLDASRGEAANLIYKIDLIFFSFYKPFRDVYKFNLIYIEGGKNVITLIIYLSKGGSPNKDIKGGSCRLSWVKGYSQLLD